MKKFLPIVFVFFFSATALFAQKMASTVGWYLHTDKETYLPGETVFFTLYSLTDYGPGGRSAKVVLLDDSMRVAETKEVLLQNGSAASFFSISFMKSSKFYSISYAPIGAQLPATPVLLQSQFQCLQPNDLQTSPDSLIHFFPEGGHLVSGLSNTVYCSLPVLQESNWQAVSGQIVDDNGDSIATLIPSFGRYGKAELLVEPNKNYHVVIKVGNRQLKQALPSAKPGSSTLLNLYPVTGAVVYRVRSVEEQDLTLEISNHDVAYYKAGFTARPGDNIAKTLADDVLQPGDNVFTLKNKKGVLLNERRYFKRAAQLPAVSIADTIRSNQLSVQFTKHLTGAFTVSITDAEKTAKGYHANLLDSITNPHEETPALLTGHLSKEVLDMIFQTREAEWMAAGNSDVIQLNVIDAEKDRVLKNFDLILAIKQPDAPQIVQQVKTDANGQLLIDKSFIKDSTVLYCYQPGNSYPKYVLALKKATAASFDLKYPTLQVRPCSATKSQQIDSAITIISTYNAMQSVKTLQEVTIKSARKTPKELLLDEYVSGMYQSRVHQLMDFDMLNEYPNQLMGTIEMFLKGRIPPENALDGNYNYFLNENLTDQATVNSMPLSEVAYISVMGRNFTPVNGQMGKAVLVYTKKGRAAAGVSIAMGQAKLKLNGYASAKPYFNELFDQHILDDTYRATLYWNSDARMDASNQLKCPLLIGGAGKLLVTISGFDDIGNFIFVRKLVNAVYQ